MSTEKDVVEGINNTVLIDKSRKKEAESSDPVPALDQSRVNQSEQVNPSSNICTPENPTSSDNAKNQSEQVNQSSNICTQEISASSVDAKIQLEQVNQSSNICSEERLASSNSANANQSSGIDKFTKEGSAEHLITSNEGSSDSVSVNNESEQVSKSVAEDKLTEESSAENLQLNTQRDRRSKLEYDVEENSENKTECSESTFSSQESESGIEGNRKHTAEKQVLEKLPKQDGHGIAEDSQNETSKEIESSPRTNCEKDKNVEKMVKDGKSEDLSIPMDKTENTIEIASSSEGNLVLDQTLELKIVSIESRANVLGSEESNSGKEPDILASRRLDVDKECKTDTLVCEELNNDKDSNVNVLGSEELKSGGESGTDVASSEELKSDDEDDLIIDLGDGKTMLLSVDTKTMKQDQETKSPAWEKSSGSMDTKTNRVTQIEMENETQTLNEIDERATSFEKLQKSLQEFENLSKENVDDAGNKEESSERNGKKKQNDKQEKTEEKQLEEEMECLLKEYQESTNKVLHLQSIDSVDSISSNEESIKASDNDNQLADEVDNRNVNENQKNKKLSGETAKNNSGSKNVNENAGSSEKTGSKITDSLDGSTKIKPKPKLYDSNELWSKLGMNRCKICNFTTDDESLFRQHMCSKKPRKDIVLTLKDGQYFCEQCLYTAKSRKMFEEHLGYHLLSHPFICLECKTTFEKSTDLEIHVKNKHPYETVRCGLRALKKIGEIIDSLKQYGTYRFEGRMIDSKTLISIMQSRERKIFPKDHAQERSKTNVQDNNRPPQSSVDANSDSSEAVVIYLSDSPTSVSNVIPENVTSVMGTSNVLSKNSTTASIGTSTVTTTLIGQSPVSNIVASNRLQLGQTVTKVPISKPTLKVPTYTAPVTVKTTAQVKNIANYSHTYSTPVLLIPVTMPSNMMNVGLPQSPGATVNLTQRMVTTGNTYLASTPVQQGTPMGVRTVTSVPARGTFSVMGQPSVPTSPLATATRFQGGQFINIGQTVQQSGIVNPSVIENSPGARLIFLPEGPSSVQSASNQMVGITNVVSNVAGPQPVLSSTAVPVVGPTNVAKSSQPLTTITTSAPPPSYAETIRNQQNQLASGNWTSILKQPAHQNDTNVKSSQHTICTSNTVSTSSLQLPTSASQMVTNTAKKIPIPSSAPNKSSGKNWNIPILPKPNQNDKSINSGILATSMVTTGEKKDGGGNKLFFRKSGGRFTCDYCRCDHDLEEKFREHIWKHFHEMQHLCKICPIRSYGSSSKCTLVERVLTGLHCAAAAKNAKSAEKKSIQASETESVVIVSDDEEEKDKSGQNEDKLDDVKNSDNKMQEKNLDKLESETENLDEKDTENNEDSKNDKEEENDSGLQLKITSIVSLHQSKKSDDVGTESGKQDSQDTQEVNENVQQSEKPEEETRKKYPDHEKGNIFEKFSEEIKAVHGTPRSRYILSPQNQTDSSPKTVTSEQSESVAETSVASDAAATMSENRMTSGENKNDAEQKGSNSESNTSNPKPLPGYEFGGSFYVCGFRECSFRCLTSPEFRDHLVNFHSSATEYLCAHCGHKSYTEDCYLRHMFVHSNTKSFVLFLCKCGACKFGTNLINLFQEHLKQTHPSEQSYKCSSCHESFGGIEELVNHLQSNLLKFVQCPYCSVKDRNRRFILSHITQTHPGKVKQITVTSQLVCHERENNAYIAPEPKQIEASSTALLNPSVNDKNSYQDVHVKSEPVDSLQETVIDNVYKSSTSQKEARRTSEDSAKSDSKSGSNAMSLLKCPKCSYIANGKGFLKKHFKVHEKGASKQRPFMCPYCPGESDIQSKFISHVGLHCGNQRPNGIFKIQVYFCSHCSFQSNYLGKIFAHGERAHATFRKETDYTTSTIKIKSRSFMCESCMFFTRSKEDYDRHMDMHKNGELTNSQNTSNTVDTKSDAKPIESGSNESQSKFESDINTGNESRRFCCKECNKTFKRLPHLKQHLSVHIKNELYQLTYFRCSYCGFSSTSKLCISRHTEEKHPGKLIRIKRRVESVSSAKPENQVDSLSDPPKVSIDTYHCDCCAFSCSDRDDLIRHTKLHFVTTSNANRTETPKPEKPPKKPYEGPTEPFIIPAGNVYKTPVNCSKCNFNTKLRLELLRHVKMHPMLIPESEQSPRKEANPQDKATKLLVKTTFLKRRLSSSPEFKPVPRKKKKVGRLESSSDEDDDYDDEMDIDDFDDNDDGKTEVVAKKPQKDTSQLSRKMEISKGSLYFLGGDLLHNKLKPCYSEEGGNGEYTCLYCGNELHEKYPLHKHMLQHMDVSFYKCAYCEFGSLEVTPIVIHIQRQHRKPIKHIQQPLNEVESKINKAIHDMKAQHYLGVPSKSPVKPVVDDTINIKMEMPDIEPALEDVSQLESEMNYNMTSIKQSPSKGFKSPERSSSLDSQDSSPGKLTKLPPHVEKSGFLFKCKICGYTSSSKATLNRHGVVHSKFKQYGCSYCPYRSHWKQDVTKHMTNVHPTEEVRVTYYDNHDTLLSESPAKDIATDEENRESLDFRNDSQFYKDDDLPDLSPAMKDEVPKSALEFWSKFKCNICLKKFNSKWAIGQHFKATECGKIPMLGCSLCKYKNVDNEKILDHIKLKHPLSPSVRVITLGRAAKFRIHKIPVKVKQSKSGPSNVQPGKSDSSLSKNMENTVSHIKVERTRERNGLIKKVGNLYKCKVCSYRGQRSNVSRHLATHSQLIKHSCPFCEYKSNWNFNIKRHVLKYHPDQNFDFKTWDKQKSRTEVNSSLEPKLLAEPTTSTMDNSNQTADQNIEIKQEPVLENEFKTKYKCLVCKQVKLSISGMYRHLQAEKCKKPMYGCPECRFKSLIEEQVKNHIKTKHVGHPGTSQLLNINAKIKKIKYNSQTGSVVTKNKSSEGSLKSLRKGKAVEVTCPSCLHVSPSRKLFQVHFDKSHKGMFLACTKCPYKTQLMIYLIKHSITMHQSRDVQFEIHRKKMRNKDVRFQCPKCAHQAKKPNMRAHLYFHLDYRPINCGHCNYKTRKQMIAKKHILSNHPGLPLKIIVKQDKNVEAEIDQMLSSMKVAESDLQQHTVSDLEIKEITEKRKHMKCEFKNCDFKCMKKKTMKMHVSIVHMSQDQHSETDFQVSSAVPEKKLNNIKRNEYDDIFSPRKNYTTEYNTNLRKEVFKCIHCQYVAMVKKSIVSHYYLHVPHIFKCPYCSYTNYPRSRIVHHITTNHGGKTLYVVDLRTNQPLTSNTSHTSSPSGSSTSSSPKKKTPTPPKKVKKEKKFMPAGSYSDIFTSEGSSDEDETSTSAKKVITYKETGKICYNCNFCSYTSTVFYHYRQHLATHGGFKWQSSGTIIESRLKCGMCAFLAINHEEFKNHMEKHLNTRPFVCPYCDFSAFSTSSVKKHVAYKHPDEPVEALKNNQSGDLVVSEGGPIKNIKLVEMDPKVKLYDIFSMESEDFEQLLTDADVSVIDLQYIPDEKFDIVSKTLGFSSDDIQELEGSVTLNSSYEDGESRISDDEGNTEDQSLDTTLTEMVNTEYEGGDSKLNDSINSTESMEYEVLDEVTDSVNEEQPMLETKPDDLQDNGLEDISDIEDETKDYTEVADKKDDTEVKDDGKQTTNIPTSGSSEMNDNMKGDSNPEELQTDKLSESQD